MAENSNGAANGAAEQQGGAQLNLQRVYIKNASFEAPNAPANVPANRASRISS